MSEAELLSEATAELYACDPDAFTDRRKILAAQARAAGATSAAKKIAGLRKPTRSAWVINQLVRADPSVPSRLAALGDELRAGEAALDGAAIRELSLARRRLIDALVRQALAVSGEPAPSAALREEVTATFGAALADPQVAEQMAAGTLVRAEHRVGFVPASAPILLPSAAGRRRAADVPEAPAPAGSEVGAAASAGPEVAAAAPAGSEVAAAAAARTRAEREAAARARAEREHQQAVAAAEQAVADAGLAAEAARLAEREQESAVRLIQEQLAEARRQLEDARLRVRRAESAERTANQVLSRLRR